MRYIRDLALLGVFLPPILAVYMVASLVIIIGTLTWMAFSSEGREQARRRRRLDR